MPDQFSDLCSYETLSEEERRAIWGLADLLENALVENDISNRPQLEWQALVSEAKAFIKTVPVEFLELGPRADGFANHS